MRFQNVVVAFSLMTGVAAAQPASQLPVTLNARLSVAVATQTLKPGEPVKLKLAFKNVSCLPIWYVASSQGNYDVAIFNEDGSAVPELPVTFYGYSGWNSKITNILWPGEETRDTLEITRFDLSRQGKYSVRVWRSVTMSEARVAAMSHLETFEVAEPETRR
jgi:hypothetical protein